MARFEMFAGRLLSFEGEFVDHPADRGGPTKYGVILSTWLQYGYDKDKDGDVDVEDLKKIDINDAKFIAKKIFWDYYKADEIKNQSVAELIADWGYNSGRTTVAKKVQGVLHVYPDGIFGKETLRQINTVNQKNLFEAIKVARKTFLERIVANDPSQKVFYKGWMNRLNSFFFKADEASTG